jgi:peptide deformylase
MGELSALSNKTYLYHNIHGSHYRGDASKAPSYKLNDLGQIIEYRNVKCPYPIVTDETFLSQQCVLSDDQDTLNAVARELKESMVALQCKSAGLAANQLGHLIRMLAIKYGKQQMLIMYDPKITKVRGKFKLCSEQCLSRPGKAPVEVERHELITVSYLDPLNPTSDRKTIKLHDFDAQVFQHELDHLSGVLI